MTIYLSADPHLGHDQIITYCNRPFKNSQLQTREIIKRHNNVVGHDDKTIWLGDFAMAGPDRATFVAGLMNRLNGTHVLVLGNHDQIHPLKLVDIGFQSVHTSYTMEYKGHNIVMAHDPSIWNVVANDNVIFLHGHIHNLYKSIKNKKIVNVGVDVWDFTPITLDQILDELGLL